MIDTFRIFLINRQREAFDIDQPGLARIINGQLLSTYAEHRTDEQNIAEVQAECKALSSWSEQGTRILAQIADWKFIVFNNIA